MGRGVCEQDLQKAWGGVVHIQVPTAVCQWEETGKGGQGRPLHRSVRR